MSRRVGNVVIIEVEAPGDCAECHETHELRPYGKNGARICYGCATKDPERTKREMNRRLFGAEGS